MKKRFYDAEPATAQAVHLMMAFPGEMQEVIAGGVGVIAEREYQARELMQNLKSLGSDMILALYKSKQKKRGYDQNPVMHRTMNYMMVLTPQNRFFISERVVEMVGFVQDYLKICRDYTASPTLSTVESITDVYVQQGPEESRQLIRALKTDWMQKLNQNPQAVQPVIITPQRRSSSPVLVEELQDDAKGMRIRGDLLK